MIFDHRTIKNASNVQRKNYAKLILDEAMKNIESASHCVLLVVEINWTGWSMGHFLRIMLDVQIKFIANSFAAKKVAVDWDHVSKFGNFLCELYSVEILKLVTMNSWMNKILEVFEQTGNETALKIFLLTLEKIYYDLKKRDLKNFEVYFIKVEKLSIKVELSNENMSKIQNILRSQGNIVRSSEATSDPLDIPEVVKKIASGAQKRISIEILSSEDLTELASLCVEEVVVNPSSKQNILRVILPLNLMHNSFKSSAHKIFRREINNSLVQQFEDDTDDLDGASKAFVIENIALSEFIAELYKSQTVHRHSIQSIFKKIKHSEDFKVLFTSVMRKVEEDFDANKFEQVNEFLHQQIQKFRARSKEIEIEEQETAMNVSQETSKKFWRAPSLVAATSSQIEVKDASKTGAVPKR